jgi:hypothetical protein
VTGRDESYAKGRGHFWLCRCDCGGITTMSTSSLRDRSRHNQSCGCAKRDSIRKAAVAAWAVTTKWSGPHKQRLKWIFGGMRRRCYVKHDKRYADWGGRGIRICDEWLRDRASFYNWALATGYVPGLSIDRIDPNGNYCPENCRFIPLSEQAGNTRKNVYLTWNGKKMTLSAWARQLRVRQQALQHRVDRGWTLDRIFTQPFRRAS